MLEEQDIIRHETAVETIPEEVPMSHSRYAVQSVIIIF